MRTELYWIEGPWPGRLAILPRPRGGDWLEDEVRAWRSARVEVVVSALEQEEIDELELAQEPDLCRAHGIMYTVFPIPDRGVPSSTQATADLVRGLESQLAAAHNVAIHCRQGVGRSAVLAACLLTRAGVDDRTAFERIRAARGCSVPDTPEQHEWVAWFARQPRVVPLSS